MKIIETIYHVSFAGVNYYLEQLENGKYVVFEGENKIKEFDILELEKAKSWFFDWINKKGFKI